MKIEIFLVIIAQLVSSHFGFLRFFSIFHKYQRLVYQNDKSHANSIISDDENRLLQMDKYSKRVKQRNEMPLSQRWYKAKQQHLSKNQKRIINSLWPIYGIDLAYNTSIEQNIDNYYNSLNFTVEKKDRHIILDVGFGSGESLIHSSRMAVPGKSVLVIGCEIHRASLASALDRISRQPPPSNVRLIRSDFTRLLEGC
jgi:tRNA G46 methylase TrmB